MAIEKSKTKPDYLKELDGKNGVDYEIDLAKLEGNGNFPCPKCRVTIDPDDESETVYKLLDSERRDDNLESLTIGCNKCESKIKIKGFL